MAALHALTVLADIRGSAPPMTRNNHNENQNTANSFLALFFPITVCLP
jgi:hypothetical protein